jgi:DNA-binding NtrC family response regulator
MTSDLLTRFILERGAEDRPLTPEAWAALRAYAWPGNVRELEHALAGAIALSRGEPEIGIEHLPERVTRPVVPRPILDTLPGDAIPVHPTLAALERAYIEWILTVEGGNRTRAARVLGIDPSTLHRKLARPFPDVP